MRGRQVRAAQIRLGDREMAVNAEGERVSRLKEVDCDWILRRLERWGRRVRAQPLHACSEAGLVWVAQRLTRWGCRPRA